MPKPSIRIGLEVGAKFEARSLKKGVGKGELIQRRKGDSTFTAKLVVWLIRDEAGEPVGFGSNRKNISNSTETKSELEASLHEKEVLLAEVHHRVKNNLQLISSLLNLQSSFMTDDSIKETLKDLQSRVRTMSLIHERLYMDDLSRINVREYTEELFDDIVATQQVSTRVSLRLDIEDFELEIQRMIPLGLMLNELITNSLKHAFVGLASGSICVKVATDSATHCKMTYSDDGLGFKNDFKTQLANGSFGSMLIDTFAEQLDGTLEHVPTDVGTTYELRF